jgi:hypothetical protein
MANLIDEKGIHQPQESLDGLETLRLLLELYDTYLNYRQL